MQRLFIGVSNILITICIYILFGNRRGFWNLLFIAITLKAIYWNGQLWMLKKDGGNCRYINELGSFWNNGKKIECSFFHFLVKLRVGDQKWWWDSKKFILYLYFYSGYRQKTRYFLHFTFKNIIQIISKYLFVSLFVIL